MSKREPKLLIDDILESIDKINSYTQNLNFLDFKDDSKTVDAVVRNLEIIGEAANHIPVELQNKSTGIKWRRIVGLRNRVVHEYFGVDLEIVWKIISDDLEDLEHQFRKLKEALMN